MRIEVIGKCESAKVLVGYLVKSDYVVNSGLADYSIELVESDIQSRITVDGVDCNLERFIISEMETLGIGEFLISRAGGVRSDRAIKITFPPHYRTQVEKGVFRGLMHELGHKEVVIPTEKRSLWKRLVGFFSCLLLATSLQAKELPFYVTTGVAHSLGLKPLLFQTAGFPITRFWDGSIVVNAGDSGNNAVRMVCVSGCVAGGSFVDNSAFTFGTTAISNTGFVVDDTGTNAVTENNSGAARMTGSRVLLTVLTDATGTDKADVNADNSLDVTCVSGCAGSSFADNAAFAFGTTTVSIAAGVFDDVAPNALTENSAGAIRLSSRREGYFQIRDAAGGERGANVSAANALKVDGSAVTQPVSGTVTANQGTPAATANRWPVQLTDGTDLSLVSGSGSLQVTCDNCGGSTFADNSAFTFGTTPVVNIGAVVDDTATNTVAENSAGNPRMNTNRILYSMNTDATGTQVGTVGSPFRVDPTGTTTQPISAASLPLPAGASTSALQDGIIKDGAGDTTQANVTTGRLHVDGSGVTQPVSGSVNIGTFPDNEPINVAQMNGVAVTMNNGIAGTGVQRVTIASDSTGNIATIGTSITPGTAAGNLGKAEDAAHASADTGIFALAVRNDADTTPTEYTAADQEYNPIATDSFGSMSGTLYMPWGWSYHENSSSTLTDTTVHASCGTGLFNYISTVVISTGAATALNAFIEDSTTTTILGPYYLEAVAGRGLAINFQPAKKQTTSATLVSITTSAAIAHSIDITGYCGR
jgi:hypothetical protein